MNIMIAATDLRHTNGGVCTHILDLCKVLTKTEKVILVADGTDYKEEINCIPGLVYIELPFCQMGQDVNSIIKCYRNLKHVCKEHDVQIIHLHGQRLIPAAWIVRLTMGIPFLWTNHIDAIPNPNVMAKMCRVMRFPIISVSTELKNQLVNELGVNADKITVINNGVDVATLQPLTNQERAEIRTRFDIEPETYVISEVARIKAVKGQHLLVRAVHRINKKNLGIKIQVLLAGSGEMDWFKKEVMDYANEHGIDCKYLGFCKPRDVYGVSDLAVLPSIYEGFQLSCIEALAMGCPALRSNTPGCADMKGSVLVCEKGSLESLTKQLEYAVTHREEMREMATRGNEMVTRRFTKEVMALHTREVYQQILGV